MIKLKHWVFGSAILLGGTILAGCGTSGHPIAIAPGHHSQAVSQSTPASPSTSSTTPSSSHVSSSPSPTSSPSESSHTSPTTSVNQSSTQATPPPITLEGIQVTNSAVILTTTHGTMQTAYQDPHIIFGSSNVFEVTLVNTSAGHLPVKHTQTIASHWGTTEEIIPQGHNLLLTFDLKPLIHQFQVGIGGGDIIQISFK